KLRDTWQASTRGPGHGRWQQSLTEKPAQRRVHVLDIELLGVEFTTDPFQSFLVLRVVRIVQDLQQLGIAPRAAHILGRTGSSTLDADRVRRTGLGLEELLN